MALTKVSGHIIDQPFDVGIITATNQYVSGIGTFGNIRVLGDLQVDGTTTTLDTVVTEVDRLEVAANNNTVGVAITQSGTGDIFNLYDGSTEVFSIADGGDVSIVDKIVHTGDTNTAIRFPAVDTVTVETGGSERVRITSDGKVGIGTVDPAAELEVYGNGRFKDADGSHGIELYPDVAGLGYQRIISYNRTSSAYENLSIGVNDFVVTTGSASERLRITSDGKVRVPDNGKFTAGASDDLQIYHDGTNSSIQNTTGYLYLYGGTNNIYLRAKNDEDGIVVKPNDSVELYHDNVKKFETTSSGVTVTGNISCGDDQRIKLGNDQDLLLYHDGSNSYLINETGDLNIRNLSDDKDVMIQSDNGSGGFETYIQADGSTRATKLFNSGSVKLETSSGGVNVTGELNVTTKVAFPDNAKAIFGAGDDLQFYHDGTHNRIKSTTGGLYIHVGNGEFLSRDGSEVIAKFLENAAVELYHNNSKKLETTTTGAKVTGALEVTQEYPSIRPVLDLNFAATKTLDRRITFTRDSIGTYVGEDGLVKYASNNVPRFDHDPTTGESLGLLIEEARTNLVEYGDFTTGWTEYGGTATSTTETAAPDGTFTAKKITSKGDQSTAGIYDSIQYSANTTYTHTMWLKAGSVTIAGITVNSGGKWASSNYPYITVNLSTGAVTASGGVSAKATEYPNGWYRLEATGTFAGNTQVDAIWVHSQTGSSMSGNTTGYYYVWGPQAEQGSFATSYIPTNGSTVTRAVEIAKITGTNFTDFYNQSEGTIVSEHSIATGVASGDNTYVYQVDDGSDTNVEFRLLDHNGAHGDVLRVYGFTGGSWNSPIYGSQTSTPDHDSFLKVAVGVKKDDFGVNFFGGTTYTDTSGDINVDMTQLTIGNHRGGTAPLQGHIRQFKYYNKRLPNAQLQGLTQQ